MRSALPLLSVSRSRGAQCAPVGELRHAGERRGQSAQLRMCLEGALERAGEAREGRAGEESLWRRESAKARSDVGSAWSDDRCAAGRREAYGTAREARLAARVQVADLAAAVPHGARRVPRRAIVAARERYRTQRAGDRHVVKRRRLGGQRLHRKRLLLLLRLMRALRGGRAGRRAARRMRRGSWRPRRGAGRRFRVGGEPLSPAKLRRWRRHL